MNLHFIPTKKFKTTVACILIRQPLERKTATVTAVIPSVLSRGCVKYPKISKINSALENMYGSIFDAQIIKKADEQIIQLYIEFISGSEGLQTQAMEFLREILLFPLTEGESFCREHVDSEKDKLKLAIESRINNKAEYAKLRALEEMCRGERFGVYGDGYAEDLPDITAEGVYRRYRELLNGSRIELVVMGDGDESALREQVRDIFQLDSVGNTEMPPPDTSFSEREPQSISERCNITQGKICMGFRTGTASIGSEAYKLMLMSEILGGSAGSKLFMNVREKENLCYYINSFVYRAKSIVFVQSGVDERNFDKTEELVKKQIREIAGGNVSESELSGAKKSLIKRFQSMQDSQGACIDFYMYRSILNDPDDYEDIFARIGRLKREDVCEMAGKMRLDTVFRLEAGGHNG